MTGAGALNLLRWLSAPMVAVSNSIRPILDRLTYLGARDLVILSAHGNVGAEIRCASNVRTEAVTTRSPRDKIYKAKEKQQRNPPVTGPAISIPRLQGGSWLEVGILFTAGEQ
jgi:hypothetical protein